MKLPNRRRLTLKERLLSLWFPARCVDCGKVITPQRLFCAKCRKALPKEPKLRRFSQPGVFYVYAPFVYQGGVRRTLHAFKFEGERSWANALGQLMAAAVPAVLRFDAVAFVPMMPDKQAERGYNQSELLARAIGRSLNCPCVSLLQKVHSTATQHELTREERLKNPAGAYRADRRADGKAILLIDDIVTTGSTLCECAKELYRNGAKSVVGLCAASAEMKTD